MVGVIESAGIRVTGGESAEGVAREWIDAGLTPEQASTYIEAGCWDSDLVAALVAAGITAEQIADDDVVDAWVSARDWASRQRGQAGYTREDMGDSLAYLHSNRDVSTDEIAAAVAAVQP